MSTQFSENSLAVLAQMKYLIEKMTLRSIAKIESFGHLRRYWRSKVTLSEIRILQIRRGCLFRSLQLVSEKTENLAVKRAINRRTLPAEYMTLALQAEIPCTFLNAQVHFNRYCLSTTSYCFRVMQRTLLSSGASLTVCYVLLHSCKLRLFRVPMGGRKRRTNTF